MSDHDDLGKHPLTQPGRARRRFLKGSALAAAGTSALTLLPGLRTAAAAADGAADAASSRCSAVDAPMKDVDGKVAFVTGGDSGIGLGIARAFTEAGMKVVITYRSKAHLDDAMKYLEGAGDRVHAISLDVTDRPGMEAAAAETVRVFGKVHVLVNNAGIGINVPVGAATYNDWDWAMGVNVGGVFNGVRAFLPLIKANGESGQIVATASIAGLLASEAGVYSTTKFAVVGLMESLRAELAGSNIGVTVFCPGLVSTNIRDSDRNRPSNLADTGGYKPNPQQMARMQEMMKHMDTAHLGMDPLDAGQRVLRGIRHNDLYVLTTPELTMQLHARDEALLASMPTDVHPPAARVALEQDLGGIYIAERDRKRCGRAGGRKA